MLDAADTRKRVLRVTCARARSEEGLEPPVTLKMTLTPKFLGRPLVDAVVAPFLGAYNKKVGSSYDKDDVLLVVCDGVALEDIAAPAGAVLPIVDGELAIDIALHGVALHGTPTNGTSALVDAGDAQTARRCSAEA
jgi:hypothetical protein